MKYIAVRLLITGLVFFIPAWVIYMRIEFDNPMNNTLTTIISCSFITIFLSFFYIVWCY